MKISLLTVAYQEELLLPYFLAHYAWADEIHLIVDADTTDRTREIALADPRVSLTEFRFPGGMDDTIKQEQVNRLAGSLEADWIIAADVDELAFTLPPSDERQVLLITQEDVISVPFWTVYRHADDADLDPSRPPLLQRRHGDPRLGVCYEQRVFTKPMIVRGGRGYAWEPGCHNLLGQVNPPASPVWRCAHWCMADPAFAVTRRCRDRRDRMSEANKRNKMTQQHWNVREEEIRHECAAHLHDPRLF